MPTQVRSEGITERMGDIILQCSGSNPGAVLSGNLSVFLPVSITNRLDSNSNLTHDAVLSVDYGGGFVPTGVNGQITNQLIAFNGLSLTVPSSGNLNIKISNIRGAAAALGSSFSTTHPILAQLVFSSTASIQLDQSQVVVAYSQTGVFATLYDKGITCTGSPLPDTFTLTNLFNAGTAFASTRVTEGFATSFQPRSPGEDNGTRFLIKYSGFPAATHLYLPDAVAGSDAAVPSISGDLGGRPQIGQYVSGSKTLLLVRVLNTDASGAGGFPAQLPSGSGTLSLDSVSEVPLTGGSGYAVYEVVDANPAAQESVQFPTFVGLSTVTAPAVAQESISFAPVSTVLTASANAPVPRFVSLSPPSDCSLLGDCGASYFPKLSVVTVPVVQLTAVAGGDQTGMAGYIPITNSGGGIMNWSASVNYQQASGWLNLSQTSGQNYGSIMVTTTGKGLAAGTYHANITIDAGSLAGSFTVPVTLTVQPAPPAPSVVVSKVVNSATLDATPLVAGSLGTLMGSHLSGKSVSVTFDGNIANLIYTSDNQINLQVPPNLAATKTSASLVVTVDGTSSTPQLVALAPAWPSVFANGILNQDNSLNSPAAGAQAGTILQIFATGIPAGATVSAQIAGRKDLVPLYAGPAPTVPGVQQVNVTVPSDLTASSTQLIICAATGGQQYCSAGSPLVIQ
ncbi:MAG TPA: hypothetical protein VGH38_04190 [Bryobacteraceae bacterium]